MDEDRDEARASSGPRVIDPKLVKVAEHLHVLRDQVLMNPRVLSGCEPSPEALWGFCHGLTVAREKILRDDMAAFGSWQCMRFGARSLYHVFTGDRFVREISGMKPVDSRAAAALEFFEDYEKWVASGPHGFWRSLPHESWRTSKEESGA